MVKTRIRNYILNILRESRMPLTTGEIHNIVNKKYRRYGPSMNQVANMLARTKGIEKAGFIDITDSVKPSFKDGVPGLNSGKARVRQNTWVATKD